MSLSSDRNTPHKDGELLPFKVAAGAKIFAGALVAINATGYAVPGATAATLTYLGRADQSVDNTAGADGDLIVLVRRGKPLKWANSGADPVLQAGINKSCYIVDDQTVAATSDTGARSAAGKVVGLDVDGVWVE
jgi:hypothetical protein